MNTCYYTKEQNTIDIGAVNPTPLITNASTSSYHAGSNVISVGIVPFLLTPGMVYANNKNKQVLILQLHLRFSFFCLHAYEGVHVSGKVYV